MTHGKLEETMSRLGADLGSAINRAQPTNIILATVESRDDESLTMDAVVDNDRVFSDISLDVFSGGGNSILIYPEIGSLVVLGFVEGFSEVPFLLKATKIERIVFSNEQDENSYLSFNHQTIEIKRGTSLWRVEDGKISLIADLFEMNEGENGGMVLIDELTEKLNAFVGNVAAFQANYNAHTHTISGTAGPYPVIATLATPMPQMSTNPKRFNKNDYENTIITQ